MINKLSDGSIIDSNLSTLPPESVSRLYRNNPSLKMGIVVAMHYPDDPTNVSKTLIEYDVTVNEVRSDGSVSTVNYYRCSVNDKFATPNNFERFTLQPSPIKDGQVLLNGARVLLLAIDGNAANGGAVIIGGLPYPPSTAITSADGQFYQWQFNGINISVDNDGQYSLVFNSPLDETLTATNPDAAGTMLQIFKDGRLRITDNAGQYWEIDRTNQNSTWTNGNESIIIDQKNKAINITSTGTMTETIAQSKSTTVDKADHSTTTNTGSVNTQAGKDIVNNANGNIQEQAAQNWTMKAGANINVQAGGNMTMQASGNAQIGGTITLIGEGSVQAAGVGISQAYGVNGGGPMTSVIITGSSTCLIGT